MDKKFVGTEIALVGIKDADIEDAKSKFLAFNKEVVLDRTKLGEIIKRQAGASKIYINGVCVALEENFAFSYNIVNPPRSFLKHLNRERNNVGRTAYSELIKKILLASTEEIVAQTLLDGIFLPEMMIKTGL